MTQKLNDGSELKIRIAEEKDVSLIKQFILWLADYEKLTHEAVVQEEDLHKNLFGEKKFVEVLIGERNGEPVAFALFFNNFSTFLGKPGIYLEDLFVKTECRNLGIGKILLSYIAKLAVDRGCG